MYEILDLIRGHTITNKRPGCTYRTIIIFSMGILRHGYMICFKCVLD